MRVLSFIFICGLFCLAGCRKAGEPVGEFLNATSQHVVLTTVNHQGITNTGQILPSKSGLFKRSQKEKAEFDLRVEAKITGGPVHSFDLQSVRGKFGYGSYISLVLYPEGWVPLHPKLMKEYAEYAKKKEPTRPLERPNPVVFFQFLEERKSRIQGFYTKEVLPQMTPTTPIKQGGQ